jgi:hypothetical protein
MTLDGVERLQSLRRPLLAICTPTAGEDNRAKMDLTFERLTDRARRVLVLAQEEARHLNHDSIDPEHLLLGLVKEGDGIAARALAELDVTLGQVQQKVEELRPSSDTSPTHSPPFTDAAKKVFELALREALALGHNYIGTEHMLLGILRKGDGLAVQVLVSLHADMQRVREEVTQLLTIEDHVIRAVPGIGVRKTSVTWMWRCTCGASGSGKWYRSPDEARCAAGSHLGQTASQPEKSP